MTECKEHLPSKSRDKKGKQSFKIKQRPGSEVKQPICLPRPSVVPEKVTTSQGHRDLTS